ncbi:hypothetical protein [Nocardia sp. NBC_00403]|uniref:hypothetical protein n=1 Tax=Nocardia sp. NBC_00403 TaxID=2975990 RepID=UPI002E2377C4
MVSIPLLDHNGSIVGVGFPSAPGDRFNMTARTSALTQHGDSQFIHVTRNPDGTENWDRAPRHKSPWTRGTRSPRAIYAIAHANPNEFFLTVRTGLVPRRVAVDGTTYGQIVSASQYFRHSVSVNPRSPILLLSCNSGAGPAARLAADVLHSDGGVLTDIHAPKGVVLMQAKYSKEPLVVATTGMDVVESPWVTYVRDRPSTKTEE